MRVLVLAASLALALAGQAAAAQPGDLDRSFGGDGRVETLLPGGPATVAGIAALADGDTLVGAAAGEHRALLVRYERDGRLDRSFGEDGFAAHVFSEGVALHDMAVDVAGRVLLAGSLGRGREMDAAILRLLPAGALDLSFGENGIARVDLRGGEGEAFAGLGERSDGRIVAAATVDHADSSLGTQSEVVVLRLHGDGAPDGSFGEDGVVRLRGEWHTPYAAHALALEPDGHVLVAVETGYTPKLSFVSHVWRLPPDGRPVDPSSRSSLNLPGEPILYDLAYDARTDRAVVAGSELSDGEGGILAVAGAVSGLTPPGDVWGSVPSYGERGKLGISLRGAGAEARAVALDGRGSAVLSGGAFTLPAWGSSDLLVVRVDTRGRLDPGFGDGGVRLVRFGERASLGAAVALQPDGRIVVAGPDRWLGSYPRAHSLQLARLHGGYDERAPRLSIRVGRAGCAAGVLRLRVAARDDSRLQRLVVRVGQRRLAVTRRARLTLRLKAARVSGRRITVEATDVAGNTAKLTRRLAACG